MQYHADYCLSTLLKSIFYNSYFFISILSLYKINFLSYPDVWKGSSQNRCFPGRRIIDNRQIDNLQIDNRQIDNLTNFRQIDNRQIDNLTFSKIDSAIPLPCPRGLGNWHHGVVGVRLGLIEVR